MLDVKGDEITRQPVMLPSGDYLQFDGELFGSDEYPESSESGSDIETLGKLLEGAKSADAKDHHMALRTVLSHLKGPWSLVYYHVSVMSK